MASPESVDPGNTGHKVTIANLDLWLHELKKRVVQLETQVLEKDKKIIELTNKIEQQVITKQKDFSSLFDNKPRVEIQFLISTVNRETREKSRIEKNIMISGIKDQNDDTDDQNKVIDVLKVLDIAYDDSVKSMKGIKRRNSKDKLGNTLKPLELVLVELNDVETVKKALLNSKKLRDNEELPNIYVSPDKTETERLIERSRRQERDVRNDALTHQVIGTEGRLRYSIKSSGPNQNKLYYWGIRSGELRQIFYELPKDKISEPRTISSSNANTANELAGT